ncbi:MAG: hypothetical protein ACRDKW_11910, partial [Actinomycetota bacterium]
ADHEGRMAGVVLAPALSPEPLTVTQGRFNLFLEDPSDAATRRMRYRMPMTGTDGRSWYFAGTKEIRDDPGADLWADTTTLRITIREGGPPESPGGGGPVVGSGILRIEAEDFVRQLATMRAVGTRSLLEGIGALERFGRAFAGALLETYGGVDKLFRSRPTVQA